MYYRYKGVYGMAGVRGIQPNWNYVDLTGLQLDDTYYIFIEDNGTHLPSPVWNDPLQAFPWTYPIQFLASGTLPDSIYFDDAVEYRLQIRKGPLTSDPLIWEINNYFADGSATTQPSGVEFQTTNQITNPQFSQISFISPLVASPDATIEIAPGWTLQLSGGPGTTTLTQIAIDGSQNIETNPPYAIGISTSGWGNVQLIQTFNQNGGIWSGEAASLAFVAKCGTAGLIPTIVAELVPSVGVPTQLFGRCKCSNGFVDSQGCDVRSRARH
jgi:hypothetical protein